MRAYWDDKARENPMWFIHSLLDYANPDEEAFWRSGEQALDRTLEPFGLSLTGAERVLEIGCGIGRMTAAIARRAASVVGLDVSAEMVARARENLRGVDNAEFVVGSGRDLAGVDSSSVDVAYSFIVFQHIPDPAATCNYIREIGRVLRPGGWTVFQISEEPRVHEGGAHRSERSLKHRLRQWMGRAPQGTQAPQWLGSSVPRQEWTQAIGDGGLHLERTIGDGTQFCHVYATRPASA
jgi:ubiquinone/menaquinone biosynthesis C-methylase UbiE